LLTEEGMPGYDIWSVNAPANWPFRAIGLKISGALIKQFAIWKTIATR